MSSSNRVFIPYAYYYYYCNFANPNSPCGVPFVGGLSPSGASELQLQLQLLHLLLLRGPVCVFSIFLVLLLLLLLPNSPCGVPFVGGLSPFGASELQLQLQLLLSRAHYTTDHKHAALVVSCEVGGSATNAHAF